MSHYNILGAADCLKVLQPPNYRVVCSIHRINIGYCNSEHCDDDEFCGWDVECTEDYSTLQLTSSGAGGFYTNKKCSGYKYRCTCQTGHCVAYCWVKYDITNQCGSYDKLTAGNCGCMY